MQNYGPGYTPYGYLDRYGYGEYYTGYGNQYTTTTGYSAAPRYGYGAGHGAGYGAGHGAGYGSGYGAGAGYGTGYGTGYATGYGSGYGAGYGLGAGYGGYGVASTGYGAVVY